MRPCVSASHFLHRAVLYALCLKLSALSVLMAILYLGALVRHSTFP